MSKSHAVGWAPEAPTPAQLKEFFGQIESGRITKHSLQAYLRNGTPSQEEAAHIVLGIDVIFPEEVAKACGVTYTNEQRKHLADTIPSVEVLKWCRDNNYAVVAGPPTEMSLLDIRSAKSHLFFNGTNDAEAGHKNELFAFNEKVSCKWLAIRKTGVPNSFNEIWDVQKSLLSENEEVPSAAEISWFITTYYEVRVVRLFSNFFVRTSSIASNGSCIHVGHFREGGLWVSASWICSIQSGLGVSASRKF